MQILERRADKALKAAALDYKHGQRHLSYVEFVRTLRDMGLEVQILFSPCGSGNICFHVTGVLSGYPIQFKSHQSMLPNANYEALLATFYHRLGKMIEVYQCGRA